jgi:hypothetical protein
MAAQTSNTALVVGAALVRDADFYELAGHAVALLAGAVFTVNRNPRIALPRASHVKRLWLILN